MSSDVGWLDDLDPNELEPDSPEPLRPPAESDASDGGDPPPRPLYDDVEPWVEGYFAQIITRRLNKSLTWCPEWWRHAEVIARLRALWETWESARLTGGAEMSSWWYLHVDTHLAVIMDGATGPLSQCSPQGHNGEPPALPTTPAPAGWWAAEEEPE